jgi:hypothetical protein
MRWTEFSDGCPQLARLGEERFLTHQLCRVGTLRRRGYPRISPCEPDFAEGELLFGMMWGSPKAQDLLRNPRCVIHSIVSEKSGTQGDFKLYARSQSVTKTPLDSAHRRAIKARSNWETPAEFHVFALNIISAGFVVFGDDAHGLPWDPTAGLRRWEQRLS